MLTNLKFISKKSTNKFLLFKKKTNYLIISLFMLLFFSCEKESVKIDSQIIGETNEVLKIHNEVAKAISLMTSNRDFMDLLYKEVKASPVSDHNSVPIKNLLLGSSGTIFKSAFKEVENSTNFEILSFEYFINDFISKYPGMSISFPKDDMVKNRSNEIYVFSEALHDQLNPVKNYYFILDGELLIKEVPSDGPNFDVVVIQEREGYVVLDQARLNDVDYFDDNSRVRHCDNLVSKLSELNLNDKIESLQIEVDGQSFNNPFRNLLFITNSDINKAYHESCIDAFLGKQNAGSYRTPPTDCGNGQAPIRDTWNTAVNDEHSLQIRLPAGNDFLEEGNDWCAWWNTNCRFQIDLYIPTQANSNEFAPIQLPYFAYYKENLIKTKGWTSPNSELRFTRWFFDNGTHGDEWAYRWMGKHRNGGTETTRVIGGMLSTVLGFKIAGISRDLTQAGNASYTSKYTNIDQLAGAALAYYCDNMFENQHGKPYFASEVQFRLKERP